MPIAHVKALSRNDLIVALQEIDALPIDENSKRMLKDILKASADPDTGKLETIIKTLPKERQAQIYQIFEEIALRQQQQADDRAKALLLLGLLTPGGMLSAYLLTPTDEALNAAQLLSIMKRAYVQGIQDELDGLGINARARQPSGEQLQYLQDLADSDAQSIMNTWNKDASKELGRLYEANPTASKDFFVQSMKAWADARIADKALFIAFNTETRAREYGRSQFAIHNYPETTKFLFRGASPVCEDCMRLWAMGAVDLAYTQKFPNPQHPRCEHYWKPVRKPKVDVNNLWIG